MNEVPAGQRCSDYGHVDALSQSAMQVESRSHVPGVCCTFPERAMIALGGRLLMQATKRSLGDAARNKGQTPDACHEGRAS